MTKHGTFITFEGIDGSGKSTQARLLAETLKNDGLDVVLTREPGGSPGAEQIRALVLEGDPDRWSAETELLLFTAARRDHLERLIWPSITDGKIVISDRFADSSRIYQGSRSGDLRAMVDNLHNLMIGQEPDLTFIIDMDPDTGLARAKGRGGTEERFEDFGAGLQAQMRAGFLALSREYSNRCVVVDGGRAISEVATDVARIAREHLA